MNEPTIETNFVLQEGDQPYESELNLASRWRRLGAAILDFVVVGILAATLMDVIGLDDRLNEAVMSSLVYNLVLGALFPSSFY